MTHSNLHRRPASAVLVGSLLLFMLFAVTDRADAQCTVRLIGEADGQTSSLTFREQAFRDGSIAQTFKSGNLTLLEKSTARSTLSDLVR